MSASKTISPRRGPQHCIELTAAERGQVTDAGQAGRVAAQLTRRIFGDPVGQLGQGLRRRDADAVRDASPLVDALA